MLLYIVTIHNYYTLLLLCAHMSFVCPFDIGGVQSSLVEGSRVPVSVSFYSSVGDDEYGAFLKRALQNAGEVVCIYDLCAFVCICVCVCISVYSRTI